jgi:protein phosphatase
MTGVPTGSFGAFEGDDVEDWDKPRKPRKWLKRSAILVVVLGLIGGGLYGAYRWTQTQYFVGVQGDHAAIYQGIEQKVAWLTLSKVHEARPTIELKYLPDYQRENVEDTIAAGSLGDARDTADALEKQAEVCRTKEAIDKAAKASKAASGTVKKPSASASASASASSSASANAGSGTASGSPSPSASPSSSTTLSPEDQTLAQQCPSGQ